NPGRGTQYKIDFKEHPYKQWFAEHGKQDQLEPTKRIKEICRERVTEDHSLMEQSSKIAKEIWILENQGLAAYLMDLADSGVQAKHNDSQLWVAYCLGIAPKPESDLVVSSVAP
ncbi:hypothetical protein ACI4B7_26025, partial [Klebsiella pneumoniae]|uniref:hypothetical protein n=2 Tax=Klebsiella pneumoniae TaxID=573 RepID=UPI00385552AF